MNEYQRQRLVDCGYHQRFVTIRKADDGTVLRGKHWVFVPYVPEAGKVRSEFQRSLLAGGRSVAPLPFVIGDLDNPRLVVIFEGKWDRDGSPCEWCATWNRVRKLKTGLLKGR